MIISVIFFGLALILIFLMTDDTLKISREKELVFIASAFILLVVLVYHLSGHEKYKAQYVKLAYEQGIELSTSEQKVLNREKVKEFKESLKGDLK